MGATADLSFLENYKDVHARLYGRPTARRKPKQRDIMYIASPPAVPPLASAFSGMGEIIAEMIDVYVAEKRVREEKARVPGARQIMSEVCAKYGIQHTEIISLRKATHIKKAKHEAMWRIRNETSLSLPQIGRLFNMSHASIKYGANCHQARIDAGEARS